MNKARTQWQMWLLWCLFLFLACTTQAVWEWNRRNTVTGDEPHYLLQARGILRYGTFEFSRPVADEEKSHEIFPTTIGLHVAHGPHGMYSMHSVGLPLLLVIPFWLAGILGAKVALTLLTSTVVFICWKIASLHTERPWMKFVAVAPVTLSLPMISAAGQIYPDMLAGLICLNALLWIQTIDVPRPAFTLVLHSLSIAFLPWLQIKNAAPAAILAAAIVWLALERRNWRLLATIAVPMAMSALLVSSYNLHAYGRVTGPYHGSSVIEFNRMSGMVLYGLFLDQHQGFLLQNPVQFIGLLALAPLFHWNWKLATTLALTFAALIVPNGLHPNWYGGWSFAGRFGWGASVVLMCATVFGLIRLQQASRVVATLFCMMGLALQAYFYAAYTYTDISLYNRDPNTWLEAYSNYFGPISAWLPAAYNVNWAYHYLPNRTVGLFTIACIVVGMFALRSYSRLTLPLVGVVAACCIWCGRYGTPHPDSINYTGRTLPSLVGVLQENKRSAYSELHREGYLTYGPYIPLSSDKYELRVRYRSRTSPDQIVGKLDVQSVADDHPLAIGKIMGTNDTVQEIVVPFEVRSLKPESYEFRNYWNGTASLEVLDMNLKRRL